MTQDRSPSAPPTTPRVHGRRRLAATTRAPGSRGPLAVTWTLAVVVVVIDQLTKVWATSALTDGRRIEVLGSLLSLRLVRNPGAAFSFATGMTWVFTLVALVVVVIVIRASRRLGSMAWAVTLGLVLGGAVGNLVDRIARDPGLGRGHVIDFIDYANRFVGNVADIAIVAAAVAVVVLSLLGIEMSGQAGPPEADDSPEPGPRAPRTAP